MGCFQHCCCLTVCSDMFPLVFFFFLSCFLESAIILSFVLPNKSTDIKGNIRAGLLILMQPESLSKTYRKLSDFERTTNFLFPLSFSLGNSIFKVHFFTPNFFPPGAGGCYDTGVCMCHGEHVTHHNPPLLYDLFHDPSESRQLTPETELRYTEVLEQTARAVERHKSTFQSRNVRGDMDVQSSTVQNQMSWEKILWRPWLQPCCGTFPFCGCKEETDLYEKTSI